MEVQIDESVARKGIEYMTRKRGGRLYGDGLRED